MYIHERENWTVFRWDNDSVGQLLEEAAWQAGFFPMGLSETRMLNLYLDGHEGKINSRTWAANAKCSKDTAIRDIQDLIVKGILRQDVPGAKRPTYSIVHEPDDL